MSDKFVMTARQAAEFDFALERNGFTPADVKKLSEGDTLKRLLPAIQGRADVVIQPHFSDEVRVTLKPSDSPRRLRDRRLSLSTGMANNPFRADYEIEPITRVVSYRDIGNKLTDHELIKARSVAGNIREDRVPIRSVSIADEVIGMLLDASESGSDVLCRSRRRNVLHVRDPDNDGQVISVTFRKDNGFQFPNEFWDWDFFFQQENRFNTWYHAGERHFTLVA